ncbi:hypothetical protein K458DRAFT_412765 [Lentithecium fluviatile CBS 122367]|uniref:Uncharacterized protein n=1 Tax=Lentithecium fluviatile CBS 122367 TaxID=1168545 RepID=A0A6G1JI33_9PLEO|nr:hypothetical protein K458DRAFT_412765 [Lentithecium fluviatile CBS 122367]
MASYFDLKPPSSKATAAPTAQLVDVPDSEAFGKMSLLSPQVTRILEELELDDKSSDEEEASLSGDSAPSDKDAKSDHKSWRDKPEQHSFRKAQTSPVPQTSRTVHIAAPSHRPGLGSAQKHPHLARFHSLRSMLFQSNLEANMHKAKESEMESQWKEDYEKRQGLSRPKTPDSPPKEGFAHKIGNKIRRMTSKEVPTMNSISENADNQSTASFDDEDERRRLAEDSEDIDHSDIEDLVRWVSQRDPPSDGERRKPEVSTAEFEQEDSGHESLGHSDVEDLVRWVSRRNEPQPKAPAVEPKHTKQDEVARSEFTDASTQSDSEDESMNDDDVDDLVRWASRREGPNAERIRETKAVSNDDTSSSARDKHEDETSGEPNVRTRKRGSSLKMEVPQARESNAELTFDDVDELVQWVSKKNTGQK